MNVVIWIQDVTPQGQGLEYLNPALNVLAKIEEVKILGTISINGISLNNVKILSKENLKELDYDLIIVSGVKASLVPIFKEAETFGIDIDRVVLDRTVCVPNFTLEKYNKLRHSKLSILSVNCCGGYIYNRFGLQFLSPTVNMFFDAKKFLTFLNDPIKNLSKKVSFKKIEVEPNIKTQYPVLSIGKDIELHMNHYPDAKTAIRIWTERASRVNFFNLLAMTYTEDQEILQKFDTLPFAKKVCFVPFKSNIESAFYINPEKYNEPFWRLVNLSAMGQLNFYDMWDMLIYGKKTPLNIE